MEKDILHRIYNGEFYPSEEIVPDDADYREKSRKVGSEFAYFNCILGESEHDRLSALKDLISDVQFMDNYANFTFGFQAGMLLMLEVLSE